MIKRHLFSIDLPYANFAMIAVNGICVEVAPIARWMKGKTVNEIDKWVKGKGGSIEYINSEVI